LFNNFPIGYDRRILASVDSTNAEAFRIVKTVSGPTWLLGLKQTQGRGRRGRRWMDPEGNFAGTLLLFPKGDAHLFALRSFVMSLALADSFEALFPNQITCELKWPNDTLLNGAKVAGILLETVALSAGQMALAIGVGVNLKNSPDASNLERRALPPSSIYGLTGQTITPEAFLPTLAFAFSEREAQFNAYGFEPIRTAWLERAANIGQMITARTQRDEYVGRFDSVDQSGHLILDTQNGRRAIAAADIYF